MGLAATSLVLAAIMAPFGDAAAPAIPEVDGVRSALARASLTGQITVTDAATWRGDLGRARTVVRRLSGGRRAELRAVLATVEDQAATGALTPSRMPLAFLTLRRNTQQWGRRAIPLPGARMTFGRDPAIFQYFPSQGVQLHPLATAGRANAMAPACIQATRARARHAAALEAAAVEASEARALARRTGAVPTADGPTGPDGAPGRDAAADRHAAGRRDAAAGRDAAAAPPPRGFGCRPDRLRALLDTVMAASSTRAGFRAWEYRFAYAGSRPLWISAMTQATAAQALARGAAALNVPAYEDAALGALAAFETPPPVGIRLPRAEYAMYSFNPGLHILNGNLQALIGLHDVAELTGSLRAKQLFADGERTARRSVAAYDTGAWSRYSFKGAESTLSYHQLVTGFLGGLCRRTAHDAYCDTEARFARYEREPPRIRVTQPTRGNEDRPTALSFSLSKISDVVVRVTRGDTTLLRDTARLPRGTGYRWTWTPPRGGVYEVRVAGVGPEGLRGVARTTVRVKKTRETRRRAERPRAHAPCRPRCRRGR